MDIAIYTEDPVKGIRVFVGLLKEDGFLYKTVIDSKHLMRKYNGYGLQQDVIDRHYTAIKGLHITNDKGNIYISYLEQWINAPQDDANGGLQRFLNRDRMTNPNKKQKALI